MTTAREKARKLLQDAPNCAECGAITVRQGDLSKCLNCGHERNWWVVLQERLAAALLPPEGHVRVRDGEGGYVEQTEFDYEDKFHTRFMQDNYSLCCEIARLEHELAIAVKAGHKLSTTRGPYATELLGD